MSHGRGVDVTDPRFNRHSPQVVGLVNGVVVGGRSKDLGHTHTCSVQHSKRVRA